MAIATMLLLYASCDYKPRNQGKSLYQQHCQNCHMEDGQGLGELMPPVAQSDFVITHSDDLACIVRLGIKGPISVNGKSYNAEMSGNSRLSDVEINNLIHYMLVDLNKEDYPFTITDIRIQLDSCED